MNPTIKRRLFWSTVLNIVFFPVVFGGLMSWSMGKSETILARSSALANEAHVASDLYAQLLSDPSAVSSAEVQQLASRLVEVGQGTEFAPRYAALAAQLQDEARGRAPATPTLAAASKVVAEIWAEHDRVHLQLWDVKDATMSIFAVGFLAALVIAGLANAVLSRQIVKPLESLTGSAQAMAEGDLRKAVELPRFGEYRQLAEAFNALRARLQDTLGKLKVHAEEVNGTTNQVSVATVQMVQGAQEQSAATEETSSAMEEIAAQIQSVSKNALDLAADTSAAAASARQIGGAAEGLLRAARDLESALERAGRSVDEVSSTAAANASDLRSIETFAQEIDAQAIEGGSVLDTSIEKIRAVGDASTKASEAFVLLAQSSRQITSIVEAMAEIADQTSLLALNAAIEAARAGEEGRGFAVVADEVRKLADRAMTSARQVAELIGRVREQTEDAVRVAGQSAEKTQEGAVLVAHAGERIRRVIESVRKANGLVARMAGAVKEQSGSAGLLKQEVDRLRGLSELLSKSAAAQASSSASVVETVERMSQRTRHVADATIQVRAGGDQVLKAVENISSVARQNQDAAQKVSAAMQGLLGRVGNLAEQVSTLKVDGARG